MNLTNQTSKMTRDNHKFSNTKSRLETGLKTPVSRGSGGYPFHRITSPNFNCHNSQMGVIDSVDKYLNHIINRIDSLAKLRSNPVSQFPFTGCIHRIIKTQNPMPEIPESSAPLKPKTDYSKIKNRVARTLFCCPEFAQVQFREMNLEDWKVHASRAWAVADGFIQEIKRRKK